MSLNQYGIDHTLKTFASLNEDGVSVSLLNCKVTGNLEESVFGKAISFNEKVLLEGKNSQRIYRMCELDEVLGPLHHVEDSPQGGCLALIGKIPVLLPIELQDRLQGLLGKRIGVLRLDGYRVRCLDERGA